MKNFYTIKKASIVLVLAILTLNFSFAQVDFDIRHIPFSRYGSYMSVMVKDVPQSKDSAVYLWDVSGRRMWQWKGVFKIEPVFQNKILPIVKIEANPISTKIFTEKGIIEICYENANTIRFKSTVIGIRLTQDVKDWSSVSFPIKKDSSQWRLQMGGYDHYVLTSINAKIKGDAVFSLAGIPPPARPQFFATIYPVNNTCEFSLEQYMTAWIPKISTLNFEQCKKATKDHYTNFTGKLFPSPSKVDSAWNLAAYLKWSTVVHPKGIITRDAALCSKNNMTAIWAWDNCFVAMATCYKNLGFALDQFNVVFDQINKDGVMPDYFNDNNTMWGFVKPPIQGFALKKIESLSTQKITIKDKETLYKKLVAYTKFWFRSMDDDHNGIPQYNHGNDSGEDNTTAFDMGYPVESPDLCTYLILQLDYLSETALLLGKPAEAKRWQMKSDSVLTYLIRELWDGNKFIAKHVFTRESNPKSKAFINYTPLLIGNKLPKNIKDKMIKTIKDSMGPITPFGPASEHPASELFEEDGYWRGAVWAPQFFFLVEGLKVCGEPELAKKMAKVYIDMCKKSIFPENFSALTGKPLRDSGYSWTSDVYLLFCYEYLR